MRNAAARRRFCLRDFGGLFRREDLDTTAARTILGGCRQVNAPVGQIHVERARLGRSRHLLRELSGLDVDDNDRRAGRRMIILAELGIGGRAAVAAEPGAVGLYLAGRDVEDRHVPTRLRRRAVAVAAAHENRVVGNNGEAVRMAALDLVKLHELAGLGIGLSEQALGLVGARLRDDRVERAARRMIGGALQVLGRVRDRNLGEDLVTRPAEIRLRNGGSSFELATMTICCWDRRPFHWRAPCRPWKFSRSAPRISDR